MGEEDVEKLMNPEDLADEDIMIPVDMRSVEGDFENLEHMMEQLGAKGVAEEYVKARKYFEANKDGEPEEERAGNLTFKEYHEMMMLNEDMEEELFEGEEEEFADDDEEGDAEEPPEKKAKTDRVH